MTDVCREPHAGVSSPQDSRPRHDGEPWLRLEARRGDALTPVEVIAIFGPTATGKTLIAEDVAVRLGTEVVSVDAMQVYRGLPILTNQPTGPTRLVGFRGLDREMSVGEFAPLAHHEIDTVVETYGAAVVAGGTGLYLRAALAELAVPPRAPAAIRARIAAEVGRNAAAAHARLVQLDSEAAARVHPNDRQRLSRALELAELGRSLVRGQDRLWGDDHRRPTLVVGLEVPAAELERRIRERTHEMLARGAVDEVRAALAGPISRTAAKTLGLREIAELDEAEAVERIVARTRRYAAYQRKWMRRIPGLVPIDANRPSRESADVILALVEDARRGRLAGLGPERGNVTM